MSEQKLLKFGAQYDANDKWVDPDRRGTGVEFATTIDGGVNFFVGNKYSGEGCSISAAEVQMLLSWLAAHGHSVANAKPMNSGEGYTS